AVFEVLGEEIEDLRAVVRRGGGPAERGAGGFDGVADVLAVAVADFADQGAIGAVNGAGIAGIRAGLLAADIHLGGPVDSRFVQWVATPSSFDRLRMRATGGLQRF